MDNNYIGYFINDINKGPFKVLKEEHSCHDSSYVVSNYKKENLIHNTIDIYALAVEQAYLDMCRTIRVKDCAVRKCVKNFKNKITDNLRDYFTYDNKGWINDYLSMNQPEKLKKINNSLWKYKYGQLQKILNMSFKYLYCCGDIREKYSEKFVKCHMTLDGLILTWFYGWIKNNKGCLENCFQQKKWSSLDVKDYVKIQNKIKEIFSPSKMKYPIIEKEFEIWVKEKNKMRFKEIKTHLNSCKRDSFFIGELKPTLNGFDDFADSLDYMIDFLENKGY